MLTYYPVVLPAQKTSDPIQNDGKTVILMALFIATALAIRLAFMVLAVDMALLALVLRMAFMPVAILMVFMPLAPVDGQDISMERFIRVAATLLPIKTY